MAEERQKGGGAPFEVTHRTLDRLCAANFDKNGIKAIVQKS